MSKGITVRSIIPGDAVSEILEELEPIIENHPRSHVVIAALTLAVLCQNSSMTPDELQSIVLGTSQYICSQLEMLDFIVPTEEIPKNLVN